MKLFGNEISSTVSRVRIALALKAVSVEIQSVSILGDDAENRQAAFLNVNPQGLVPALITDDGTLLTQSLAIIEYLDETYPEPRLLPINPDARAFARSIALSIEAEIHALLPPRVAARLKAWPSLGQDEVEAWNKHWIIEGLTAVEARLASRHTGALSVGDTPTIADIFLFPQVINLDRARIDIGHWPKIAAVIEHLRAIPAFRDNAPAPRK